MVSKPILLKGIPTMKKIFIAALCFASSASFATTVCPNAANAKLVADSTTQFVKTGFTPKCSANTTVGFDQGANAAAVGAVSSKGNQIFSGHTQGGAVTKLATGGDCAATGCTATNATDASAAALAVASTL
jgi:hypothetical protein